MGVATFFAVLDTLATTVPLDPPATIASLLGLGLWGSLALAAALAPLGIPSLAPMAFVYRWVSGWFRGAASHQEVAAVLAWSMWPLLVPWVVSWTARLAMFGGSVFAAGATPAGPQTLVLLLLLLGQVAGLVWCVVILVTGIAEVNGFSTGESVATNVIATLIVVVPLLVLAVIGAIALVLVLMRSA